MRLYRHEVWNDWQEGRPEWEFSASDDDIWMERENAEAAIIEHAVRVLKRRESARESERASILKDNAQYEALLAAGLNPNDFRSGEWGRGKLLYREDPGPFDWDRAEDTTLTDEQIGVRVLAFETVD